MTTSSSKYVNRELGWLSFNERVLQEAANVDVPLLERLKFLGIFSSNLDEFFRVRVGTLQRMLKAGIKAKAELGSTPKKILLTIHDVVLRQRAHFDEVFGSLYKALEAERIFVINEKRLNDIQTTYVQTYFREQVRPRLVPIMLNEVPKFPYLKNQEIYLAVDLIRPDDDKSDYALIEVPTDLLPRFIVLPKSGGNNYVIMLDDIIRFGLPEVFAVFDYRSMTAYTIKLTRDAELEIEDDVTQSLLEKISTSLRKRLKGQPVRFVYDREIPGHLLKYLLQSNNLEHCENLIPGGRYHNARDFIKFPNISGKRLEYESRVPIPIPVISKHKSIFDAIRQKDILLHFPYHSFQHAIDLLREAAIDPKVVSISTTLYRVAKNSNVVNALLNAVRNGKRVNVLLELKARFDEEANIQWTQCLEEEGAHLMEDLPGLKVHAKLCLITRREKKGLAKYAIIGTGNFNEATAKTYSDHALLTTNHKVTAEVARVFSFLNTNYKTYTYKHLLVAPFQMRKRFSRLIKNEAKHAKAGKEAYIYAKVNSLVDRRMIDKLYEASRAGVKIKMVVRGICSLIPGIEGQSENIEVISIIDKYLEHSRIFIFCNEGRELCYLSSADWMERNLDRRVEVAVPILDKEVRQELKRFFEIQWNDRQKARIINAEQDNAFREKGPGENGRAQDDLYAYLNDGDPDEQS